jgi:hypothetical protein
MSRFTICTPGVVSSYQASLMDFFAVSTPGTKHVLHTTKYMPGGRELGQLVPSKLASWDVEVPEGARLFSVTGGVVSGRPMQFWVGWLVDRTLQMQALMQEGPINTELVAGEVPIFPAIMDGAGHAALYSWRPTPTGATLWRRLFSGAIHQPGTVTAAQVSELPANPAVSFAGAVSGEESEHALIGWLEDGAEGSRMGVVIIRPGGVEVLRSEPIPRTTVFGRQRIGVWAAAFDRLEIAAILENNDGSGGYQLARFAVAASSKKGAVTLLPRSIPAGELRGAALEYYKNNTEAEVYQSFIGVDGVLLTAYAVDEPARPTRLLSSLDDPLPIVTTGTAAFYASRSDDDRVTFEPL